MALTIIDRDPLAGGTLGVDQDIKFTINGSVILSTILISINDTVIYLNEAALGGYTVLRTLLADGVSFEVAAPTPWSYAETVRVSIYAEEDAWWYRWFVGPEALWVAPHGGGEPMSIFTDVWTMRVAENPSCFVGPVNSFETSLLFPYDNALLAHTETLRGLLLDHAIEFPHANRAVRFVNLTAHGFDLSPVLRDLVPTPTTDEKDVRLCHHRSNVELDTILRRKPAILDHVLAELRQVGLPLLHYELLATYNNDDPNSRVPLACLMLCLAKALDVNAVS